ncbi:hypothetical protein [Corynebacterium diphtheriae]|uniref:hypothetical protein n=1 Tax=Corynebacterium diphtheriae TaxID=1717 RepID=UPI0002467E43|nr:hypothetical protein [Corynebacterium diphtheriae]AEX67282.1 hypothetical protein CDC7B_1086 [Corynebacterium diphtheriae C7 (beta)]MBG9277548.1 hypothetical protein [Corynebacterium diphtheriae bv. mitis]MBG9296451.1 hypothetical protein [Corynebacterium diphtheriae bv. gravis]MBG9335758.1 hypothetical protein [Corynebacterium diphtheriae bv. gravis]UEB35852.1 hypothetical protein LK418_03460 [Corynebacterium diphtheriae subsp. diphtheriae]
MKDLLKVLINVVGQTGELPMPVARPQTAMERVKRTQIKKRLSFIESQLFPEA